LQPDISMRISPQGMSSAVPPISTSDLSANAAARVARRGKTSPIIYDGELGELARLFFLNLGLSLLTLGIYRFWGKTKIRRYLWSHISLQDERLEYTGTGRELFLGFLKTGAFVAVLVVFNQILPEVVMPDTAIGIFLGLFSLATFGFLYLAAQFAAQRYRLSRTQWCGIRGGMDGSAWAFAFRAGGLFVVSAMLIGLLVPWWRMRTMDWRIKASRIGNISLYLDPARAVCFWSFMLGFILLAMLDYATGPILDFVVHLPLDPATHEAISFALYVAILLIVAPLAFAPYFANMQQQVLQYLRFGSLYAPDIWLESRVTAGAMFLQLLSAVLLIVFTLGLAWPLVLHRWVKFTTQNIIVHGEIDTVELKQSSDRAPKASEGLLEALDPGFF
jgi:uncharacterized membrane protein YjgN (DUF898 family)